jgi:hypothetical protein
VSKSFIGPERRSFGRRASQMHGWICPDGRPRIPCIVRNFSETGALIEAAEKVVLPDYFVLTIDAVGVRVGCEVRHEQAGLIGVRFVEEKAAAEPDEATASPMSTYERLLALANADRELDELGPRLRPSLAAKPRA